MIGFAISALVVQRKMRPLIAAILIGESAPLIATSILFLFGVVAVAKVGLPRGYWQHVAAIWRC